MQAMPKSARTCKNCVHENDSGPEFCGGCSGDYPTAWTESPYNVEDRADKEIAKLKERIAELETDARLVTVCDACLHASCWRGEFMCAHSKSAGTVDLPVSALRQLDREHSDYWAKLK
jgi:hypothetical protein